MKPQLKWLAAALLLTSSLAATAEPQRIATVLKQDPRIAAFTVESENFESIHNHSAYAKIIG